jgi:hypothetical protein
MERAAAGYVERVVLGTLVVGWSDGPLVGLCVVRDFEGISVGTKLGPLVGLRVVGDLEGFRVGTKVRG